MKSNLILLFLSTMFFISCNKEDIIKTNSYCFDNCKEFKSGKCMVVYYVYNIPYYRGATFNPLNPEEIIYYKSDSMGTSLIKYNLTSKEEMVLLKNFSFRFSSRPAWGRSGWIAFSSLNWKIWRMRDDGSDLKQISFKPGDHTPDFDYWGEKIIYSQNMNFSNSLLSNYPEYNLQRNNQIIDVFGNKIDSICQPIDNFNCQQWGHSRWASNNQILYRIYSEKTGVGLFDYNSFSRKILFSENFLGKNQVVDFQWHPSENSFFYSTVSTGIFQYHFNTGHRNRIKNACNTRFYEEISVSPDGKKIIASRSRVEFKEQVFCKGITTLEIVIMDIDGCNERIIELP